MYYSFLHTTPAGGYNYYRLKMIDADGRFTYSPIVRTGGISKSGLFVYPNPVASVLQLNATVEKEDRVYFKIISADGRVAAQQYLYLKTGVNAFNWNVASLPAGQYYLVSTSAALGPVAFMKR